MRIVPPRSESEIRFLEPVVSRQNARGADPHETPIFQHPGPVSKCRGTSHVLLHEENRDTGAVDGGVLREGLSDRAPEL
jgi:hypothetical protein